MLGTKKIENNTMPTSSKMPVPGQCINLNRIPKDVREMDTAPVINANTFIRIQFKFSYSFGFSDPPRFFPPWRSGIWAPLVFELSIV
ncbi:MAG: hypothetical protein A2W93_08700 [Bacteroidetes bacterium GWF2_43_63]|nr:MAG: hypothetical protein A2W94_03095 [Bacteroidetes bacterium GWE2_42_42]OFY55210.1 MAG: hypothetical protein A2W93_08700 [Bacteroidetes bacterium GWF2_43_63]